MKIYENISSMKEVSVERKIRELKERHRMDIALGLKGLLEEKGIQYMEEYDDDLALALEEVHYVSETGEYESYMKMLEEIENVNPKLAVKLEEYFLKELNLVALLGFQMGARVGRDKSDRDGSEKLV